MKSLLLEQYVGKEVQLRFKGDITPQPNPSGVGKLEPVVVYAKTSDGGASAKFYRLNAEAMMGDPRRSGLQPTKMILPLVFDAEDVLWVSTGPVNMDGEQAIVTPGNGGRSPSGLVLPR